MNILISAHAHKKMQEFSQRDVEKLQRLFQIMEAERFPKIRAMLRSDSADDDGSFVRNFEDFRVVYKFLDDKSSDTGIIIVTIIKGHK